MGVVTVRGTVRRIKGELERAREERQMIRDFHAASPRLQEELAVIIRRDGAR